MRQGRVANVSLLEGAPKPKVQLKMRILKESNQGVKNATGDAFAHSRKVSKWPLLIAIIGIAHACIALDARGAVITSDTFSVAMGKTSTVANWNTTETASVNVPPGSLFALAVNVSSGYYSTGGPTFTNAVIGTYGGSNFSGKTSDFNVFMSAAYAGPAPVDVAAIPNYQLTFVITNISVYAASNAVGDTHTLNWREVPTTITPTAQSQDPQTLDFTETWQNAAGYEQLSWDPSDTPIAISARGNGVTRNFVLDTEDGKVFTLDGYRVTGYIQLTYDAVPEPKTYGLLGLFGSSLLLGYLRRRSILRAR